jgi:hypothetical protein
VQATLGPAEDVEEAAAPPEPRARADAPAAPPPVAPTPPRESEGPLPSGLVTTRLRPAQAPPPAAEPALPAGAVVSTGLRPWIALDLAMTEVEFTAGDAILRYRLSIANTGMATAQELVIEALPLNAGESQDRELAAFFERRETGSPAIAALPRLGALDIDHEVRMPRGAILPYEVQGRRLFVPILAFAVTYRWSGGSGRTGAAFLIGHQQNGSERLAPLRLEQGGGRAGGLGARRLDPAVRR